MTKQLIEFITKIPKSDLHVHLDGSVRIETLLELSKKHKLTLPSYDVSGLKQLVFKDQYQNLEDYLQTFNYLLPVMQTPENLEQISYEFALDNIKEGICYVEVRFAPQLHINESQDIEQVLLSVNRGLNKAKTEYNQTPDVKSQKVPEFNYGIIACAIRSFAKGYAKFFDLFLDKHQNDESHTIYGMASYELTQNCINVRDKQNIPIVAIDLAGAEAESPPIDHKAAYHLAHQNFMHLTTHAGEACGPENIYQAVIELNSERIGHGFSLFSQTKQKNINQLIEYIATKRITIEVCLTSNTQTMPQLKNFKDHPFAKMIAANLSTVICTDNRTVSNTTLTNELLLATQNFNLTKNSLKELVLTGFKQSFYPEKYTEKLHYIEQIQKQYDELVKKSDHIL